ncbi:MAG: hypothetical protein HXY28_00085, partial [Hydrogenophilaceae bacterium]|nr:hypothetical protein [Hydrogenophilaceae bacterium]
SAAPAGAEAAILAWARAQYGEIFEPLNIFYGDFTGDGAPDAFAWVNYPTGGNSAGLDVPLFRNQGGRMVYWRSEQEVFGEQPRNIAFAPGRITLTTSVLRDQDPRCCPTGARNWTINTN